MPRNQEILDLLEQDRNRVVDQADQTATVYGKKLQRRLLETFIQGGDLAGVIREEMNALIEIVTSTRTFAFLMGMNRSYETFVAHRGSNDQRLFSAYTDAVKFAKQKLKMSPEDVEAIRTEHNKEAFDVVRGLSDDLTETITKGVQEVISKNLHVKDGVKLLEKRIAAQGMASPKPYLLSTIVRNQTNMAYAAGREKANQQDFIANELWGYEYSAVGDDRTRPSHLAMDGMRLPKEDPRWERLSPPNGHNCRCVKVEIWKDDKALAKEKDPSIVVLKKKLKDGTVEKQEFLPEPDKGWEFNPANVVGGIAPPGTAVVSQKLIIEKAKKVKGQQKKQKLLQHQGDVFLVSTDHFNNDKRAAKFAKVVDDDLSRMIKQHPILRVTLRDSAPLKDILLFNEELLPGPKSSMEVGRYANKKVSVACKFTKLTASSPKRGQFSVPGDDLASRVRHEVGHHVWTQDPKKDAFKAIFKAQPKEYWEKSLSKYGATGVQEAYSEAFTLFTHKKYQTGMLPEEVESHFRKVIGDNRLNLPIFKGKTIEKISSKKKADKKPLKEKLAVKASGLGPFTGKVYKDEAKYKEAYREWLRSVRKEWRELEAIENFTGAEYGPMRKSERSGRPSPAVRRIYSALGRAPRRTHVLYRGMSDLDKNQVQAVATVGNKVELNCLHSFSRKKQVARDFAEEGFGEYSSVVWQVKTTSGVHIRALSELPEEDEVLLPAGVKFRIAKVNKPRDVYSPIICVLEEV